MITRHLHLLALSGTLTIAAHAQTSIYGFGGLANWAYQQQGDNGLLFKGNTGNFGGGAFYNFSIDSRVTVGLDGRAALTPGDKGGYLAGAALRIGFVPHHNPLRPYFQIGGGLVHTTYDDSLYNYDQFGTLTIVPRRAAITTGAAQLAFGLDIRLTDHLDLIAPEYGAQGSGRAGLGYLNGGLVYHLAPRH